MGCGRRSSAIDWPPVITHLSRADQTQEEQRTAVWEQVLNECISRGHHWVKGKDVTYLKKSKWPGIKRDAIEHFQADQRGGISHRRKLTEADIVVLRAIRYESSGGSAAKGDEGIVTRRNESLRPITVEVREGRPLDFLPCGIFSPNDEDDKVDNGLLAKLFSKDKQMKKATPSPSGHEDYTYRSVTKRQKKVDDYGPIDHELMAALGFSSQKKPSDASKYHQQSRDDDFNCKRMKMNSPPEVNEHSTISEVSFFVVHLQFIAYTTIRIV
uniref:Myb_DNA-bind_3 domain-containing protein n=1 Tax=Heterorhabditis bacteriophora TaxID=37862 RepID=A0A1I7XM12_HETBA